MKNLVLALLALLLAVFKTPAYSQSNDSHEYELLASVSSVYPGVAQQRGLEAVVLIEFDLTEEGLVENPRILKSDHGDIFHSSALGAIQSFRYRPRKIHGTYLRVENVQQEFTYCIKEPSEQGAIQQCRK